MRDKRINKFNLTAIYFLISYIKLHFYHTVILLCNLLILRLGHRGKVVAEATAAAAVAITETVSIQAVVEVVVIVVLVEAVVARLIHSRVHNFCDQTSALRHSCVKIDVAQYLVRHTLKDDRNNEWTDNTDPKTYSHGRGCSLADIYANFLFFSFFSEC